VRYLASKNGVTLETGSGFVHVAPSKLIISCDCPADHFRKSASKSVKTISKYCVKKFDMVGRKEEGTR